MQAIKKIPYSIIRFSNVLRPSTNLKRWASAVPSSNSPSEHFSPAVAYLLRKHQVSNPSAIPRTGKQGRLLKSDVLSYLRSRSVKLTLQLPKYRSLEKLRQLLQGQWQPSFPVVLDHVSLTKESTSPLNINLKSVNYMKKPYPSVPVSEQLSNHFLESLAGIHHPVQTFSPPSSQPPQRDLFEELVAWPGDGDPRFLPVLNVEIVVPSSCSETALKQVTTEIMDILDASPFSSS